VTRGFAIKRGVKQGDALSCILFIICMEPLLRNIEENKRIECIRSNSLGDLPKAYAYADDVNGLIRNTRESLQELFNEYSRLTNLSGLELNADKTEIMRVKKRMEPDPTIFRIKYLNVNYNLKTQESTKINGIYFQQSYEEIINMNVANAVKRIEQQLKPWSRRSLSTLGKILVAKTFGVSQVIYLLQSLRLEEKHFKLINSVLYKFIWNRHFLAAKAPERIKREITNKSCKLGGLGMLEIVELDAALKLKALVRMMSTNHPFLCRIRNRIDLEQFLYPAIEPDIDPVASEGVKILRADRLRQIESIGVINDRKLIGLLKETRLRKVLNKRGLISLAFNIAWRAGKRTVGDLTRLELAHLRPFIERNIFNALNRCIDLNGSEVDHRDRLLVFYNGNRRDLTKLSSKNIRLLRSDRIPICQYKVGLDLTVAEAHTWLYNVNRITSIRLRNTIFRTIHGDIFCKERLFRFGLVDSPLCARCNNVETLNHKILECDYARKIIKEMITATNRLRISPLNPDSYDIRSLLGVLESDETILTVHAEILSRIISLRDTQNYLLRPKSFVRTALEHLARSEPKLDRKEAIKSLLE